MLAPIGNGGDSLLIVAGYATPAMVSQFVTDADNRFGRRILIDLVVGMVGRDGSPNKTTRVFSH